MQIKTTKPQCVGCSFKVWVDPQQKFLLKPFFGDKLKLRKSRKEGQSPALEELYDTFRSFALAWLWFELVFYWPSHMRPVDIVERELERKLKAADKECTASKKKHQYFTKRLQDIRKIKQKMEQPHDH